MPPPESLPLPAQESSPVVGSAWDPRVEPSVPEVPVASSGVELLSESRVAPRHLHAVGDLTSERALRMLRAAADRTDDAPGSATGRHIREAPAGVTYDRDDPLEIDAVPHQIHRISRAVSVPVTVAIIAFVAAVAIAVAVTAAQLAPFGDAVGSEELAGASTDDPLATASSDTSAEQPDAAALAEASSGTAASAPLAAGSAANTAETLVVHVVGEVRQPGIVEVVAGARVSDAITAAGGPADTAVLSGVNLARAVIDGEQIVVPNAAGAAAPPVANAPAQGGALGAGALVNLNTADVTALDTLPGVGPALAQRIVDWREANGGYASVEQLLDVSGIGTKTFESMRDLVVVG